MTRGILAGEKVLEGIKPKPNDQMKPEDLMMWALFAGVAWVIFASLTGADEWLKSLFGKSKLSDLEERIQQLETRLNTLDKK